MSDQPDAEVEAAWADEGSMSMLDAADVATGLDAGLDHRARRHVGSRRRRLQLRSILRKAMHPITLDGDHPATVADVLLHG
jgi:hypothetical protein